MRDTMASSEKTISLRRAVASGFALLVIYVGVVHEVVGSTLSPEGPADLGGVFWWHAAGALLIVLGALLFLATLDVLRFPVRIVALGISAAGCYLTVDEAIRYSRFHLFTTTLFLAGAAIALLSTRLGQPNRERGTAA